MEHDLLVWLTPMLTSPWLAVVIFAVCALDAFFPVVPSETLVIGAAALAVTGRVDLAVLAVAAAVGAFVGDNVSYLIGRGLERGGSRFLKTGRRAKAYAWAARELRRRDASVLIGARFLPGGRTATTLVAGALKHDPRRFRIFTAIAAVCWSAYAVLIGTLGGIAFREHPLYGVALGIAIAVTTGGTVELVRILRGRRAARRAAAVAPAAPVAEMRELQEVGSGRTD